MMDVSKDTFDKVISTMGCDEDFESDADFDYKIYVNQDGVTLGAVSSQGDEVVGYSLFGAAAEKLGDTIDA